MRSFIYQLCFMAAVSTALRDVTELREDTFHAFIEDHDVVLTAFTWPFSRYCQVMTPEYEKAATALKEKNIPVANIDCLAEMELCQSENINMYPTIELFQGHNHRSSYRGRRSADDLVSYVIQQSTPITSPTRENIRFFKTADKVAVIGYLPPDDEASRQAFFAVAELMKDDCLFGIVSDPELAKEEGAELPEIMIYISDGESKVRYGKAFEVEAIKRFIEVETNPPPVLRIQLGNPGLI